MSLQNPKPRRRILNSYTLIWVAVALVAIVYLSVLATHPDLLASAPSESDVEKELARTKSEVSSVVAEVEPLKQSVGDIKTDVATLKIGLQEAADRDRQLLDKETALETSAAAPKPMAQAVSPAAPATKAETHKPAAVASAEAPAPVAAATPLKKAAQKGAAPLETGSIAPAKGAAAAKPQPVGLLLGTGPTVDAVRLSWTILNDRHGDAVRDLHPRYVASGKGKDRVYALVAGPVASPQQASTLCRLMTDRGLPCEVSVYRGTAF
jgi:hypothetical protein